VEAEAAIGVHALAEGQGVDIGVEDRLAVALELGDGARLAPVDEGVPARQDLHVALAGREEVVWGVELLHQLHGPGPRVQFQELAAAVAVHRRVVVDLVAGEDRGVVEETDPLDGAVGGLEAEASVMLVSESEFCGHVEGGVRAAETPDDGAVGAVDLDDGGGVAAGDEVVSRRILVDGVDVEVIPGASGVGGDCGEGSGEGERGVVGRDVIEGAPFEDQIAAFVVDF